MKTPRPYQEVAVQRALQDNGFLLADEPGVGKTITGIEIAKRARTSLVGWRCAVIVPQGIRKQWQVEIESQDPGTPVIYSDYIPWDYSKIEGWVIVGYPEMQGNRVSNLMKVLWDIVILDEAHRIKNRKTVSADVVKKIPSVRRLAMTGTPWEKSQSDLWSIFNWTRPEEFPSYYKFCDEWLDKIPNYFEHFKYGGPKDPEEFAEMASSYMMRRTKREVRPDMPEKLIFEIPVDFSEKQEQHYQVFRNADDVLVEVEDKEFFVQNVLTKLVRAQQISTDPLLLGLTGSSGKLLWLQDFIEDHAHEGILIFSRFRDTVIRLADKYGGDLIVGGGNSFGEKFKAGETNLLFGTIDAMGEGLDGVQRANHAVFLDALWSGTKMTQAMDRIDRIDIVDDKNIHMLHSCREDRLVLEAINNKWTLDELVFWYMKGE